MAPDAEREPVGESRSPNRDRMAREDAPQIGGEVLDRAVALGRVRA